MHLSGLFNIQYIISSLTESITDVGSKVYLNQDFNLNQSPPLIPAKSDSLPVVIWHGLGDNYNSSGINQIKELFDSIHPGIFVYSISLDEDPSSDQQRSFFGDANVDIDQVCQTLSNITELATGFNAIGFSQGGLLLRGLIERCSNITVYNLITFGSPHLGVSELPMCRPNDWLCKTRNNILKRQVWLDKVQKHVIPAQYFRDPGEFEKYLEYSHFLADINNERDDKNATYKDNFSNINKLVLVTFTEDTTLVPKDSAWFFDYDPDLKISIPFQQTKLYQDNYIGLKSLHERNSIDFLSIKADHMRIPEEFIRDIAITYL
ncbi:hypothetical protein JA1_000876 [Spathaspora sp. JA1]|nr:hypothetical protein JA1_000876 [Spathaspora sp. JA1]